MNNNDEYMVVSWWNRDKRPEGHICPEVTGHKSLIEATKEGTKRKRFHGKKSKVVLVKKICEINYK